MTALVALTINGRLMGLTCDATKVSISLPQPSTVPPILHPTALQLTTPHHDWIDRWPFPKFRDNLIILRDVVDTDELFKDFFMMSSCSVKDGEDAWDPRAWHIDYGFHAKWGYLFY